MSLRDRPHVFAIAIAGEPVAQLQRVARLKLERQGQCGIWVEAVRHGVWRAGTRGRALLSTDDSHAQRAGVVQRVVLEAQVHHTVVGGDIDQSPPDQADADVCLCAFAVFEGSVIRPAHAFEIEAVGSFLLDLLQRNHPDQAIAAAGKCELAGGDGNRRIRGLHLLFFFGRRGGIDDAPQAGLHVLRNGRLRVHADLGAALGIHRCAHRVNGKVGVCRQCKQGAHRQQAEQQLLHGRLLGIRVWQWGHRAPRSARPRTGRGAGWRSGWAVFPGSAASARSTPAG